jgi:hypothetical protein
VPEYVLQHHDRVVEQQADAEGQAAEAHDVQRQASGAHHGEGGHERNGIESPITKLLRRLPRKSNTTIIASVAPRTAAVLTALMELRMKNDGSRVAWYVMSGGMKPLAESRRISRLMRPTTATVFAPGQLRHRHANGGLAVQPDEEPLFRVAVAHLGQLTQAQPISAVRQRDEDCLDVGHRPEPTVGLRHDIEAR